MRSIPLGPELDSLESSINWGMLWKKKCLRLIKGCSFLGCLCSHQQTMWNKSSWFTCICYLPSLELSLKASKWLCGHQFPRESESVSSEDPPPGWHPTHPWMWWLEASWDLWWQITINWLLIFLYIIRLLV